MLPIHEFLSKVPPKHRKPFLLAYTAALTSKGVGDKMSRHGAVILHKHVPLVAKCNSMKTHPVLCRFTKFPFLHAEQACLLGLGLDNTQGKDLYVVRVLGNGRLGPSKPCEVCQRIIKEAGIRNCFYSTQDGGFEQLVN